MIGYFGKTPTVSDFVFHGLPMRLTDAWANLASAWVAEARLACGAQWNREILAAPVWRFLLPANLDDVADIHGATGLMAGSVDGAGRIFPFSVIITWPQPQAAIPDTALDGALDRIEPHMLSFMEGLTDAPSFARILNEEGGKIAPGKGHPIEPPPLLLTERAACFSGVHPAWMAGNQKTALSLPIKDKDTTSPPICYWWHDGAGSARPAQFCATRGMPKSQSSRFLFCSNWADSWQQRPLPSA